MARLNDAQVEGLLARLEKPSARAVHERVPHLEAHRKLSQACANGVLGPIIAQQLAAYLHRPVRCASSGAVELASERTVYSGRSQGVEFWVAMDSLLAASIADAMIGGEGDPTRVGLGSRVMRVAAGAIGKVFAAVAEALDLPPPAAAEHVTSFKQDTPLGGGTLAIGPQSYHWQIGLTEADTHRAVPPARVAAPAPRVHVAADEFEASLENARAALERAVRRTVTFAPAKIRQLTSPAMPQGWLRLGVPNRAGGAVILAADEPSGAALLNALLGTNVVDEKNPGVLAQTGAETLLLDLLHAFTASLLSPGEETQRAMRLTDDAILASLPHHAIEHDFSIEGRVGRLHWLVPSQRLQTI